MRITGLTIAILAMICTAAPSPAGDGAPAGVRNCTWCHGTSGHGYANAPELAGQRHQYIENQLLDFHNHVRDNPFSQQYMWGAAANLNAQTARDLAVYFSMLRPKPANDGVGELAAIGRDIYLDGIPEFNIVPCAACHGPNAEGVRDISMPRRTFVRLPETKTGAMGPRIPCGRAASNAEDCQQIAPRADRGAGVIP